MPVTPTPIRIDLTDPASPRVEINSADVTGQLRSFTLHAEAAKLPTLSVEVDTAATVIEGVANVEVWTAGLTGADIATAIRGIDIDAMKADVFRDNLEAGNPWEALRERIARIVETVDQ